MDFRNESFFISYKMANSSRDELLLLIDESTRIVKELKLLLSSILETLEFTTLDDCESLKLCNEKEDLEEDISEESKDIAMYEEQLHILDLNSCQGDYSFGPYEDHYNPLYEVFTGGDY